MHIPNPMEKTDAKDEQVKLSNRDNSGTGVKVGS